MGLDRLRKTLGEFEGEPRQRIAMECGTHSPWISRLLKQLGHQVIVANARKLRAISQNESKNDRADAEMLARLAASDPRLLAPSASQPQAATGSQLDSRPRRAGAGPHDAQIPTFSGTATAAD